MISFWKKSIELNLVVHQLDIEAYETISRVFHIWFAYWWPDVCVRPIFTNISEACLEYWHTLCDEMLSAIFSEVDA